MQELHHVIAQAKTTFPELDFEIATPFLDLPPLDTSNDALVSKAMVAACKAVTGNVRVTAFPGSTDAPNFRCPTVICGPGDLAQCHSLNEYVSIDQIEDAVRIYVHAIQAMQTDP